MKLDRLRNITFATILGTGLISCSCEQRLARLEYKCGTKIPVQVDTFVMVRDSLYLDTVFDFLTDTLFFQRDSITVMVLRDTVNKKTYVNIISPPVEKLVTVKVPVIVPATWSTVWAMAGTLVSRWNWWLVLTIVGMLLVLLLKWMSMRR